MRDELFGNRDFPATAFVFEAFDLFVLLLIDEVDDFDVGDRRVGFYIVKGQLAEFFLSCARIKG